MSADLLRRAARVARETADAADTGETWQAARHWDALWVVDFKPSVPPAATVSDRRDLDHDPNAHDIEQPADIACHATQAMHIALWHPGVARAVADWLEGEADVMEIEKHSHAPEDAVTIASLLVGEEGTTDE